MAVGSAWKQKVALSILGEQKSGFIPDTAWLGLRDSNGEVGERVTVDTASGWAGDGDGVTNTNIIEVGEPGEVEVTEVVLWDAAESGNEFLVATLDEPMSVADEEPVVIPVGGLFFEVL